MSQKNCQCPRQRQPRKTKSQCSCQAIQNLYAYVYNFKGKYESAVPPLCLLSDYSSRIDTQYGRRMQHACVCSQAEPKLLELASLSVMICVVIHSCIFQMLDSDLNPSCLNSAKASRLQICFWTRLWNRSTVFTEFLVSNHRNCSLSWYFLKQLGTEYISGNSPCHIRNCVAEDLVCSTLPMCLFIA